MGEHFDFENYADLYGNKATANWNPRIAPRATRFIASFTAPTA